MDTRTQVAAFREAAAGNLTGIISRLEFVVETLISLHRELASLLSAEKDGKVRAWTNNNATTLGERDRIADFHALDLTREVIRVKGEIAAFVEERDFLRLLVGYNG